MACLRGNFPLGAGTGLRLSAPGKVQLRPLVVENVASGIRALDAEEHESDANSKVGLNFGCGRRGIVTGVIGASLSSCGLGPQAGVVEKSRKVAVTCYAKEVRCSTEGQGQTQTIKNETVLTNKAPLQSKEKSPKLDDGGTGLPPRDGDGGGGGGGGGGWGGGGFVFWALLLLIGFLRDRELDKPYAGPKLKKKEKRRQFT